MMLFSAAGSSGRLSGAIGTPAVDQIRSGLSRLNHWLSRFTAACRQTKLSRPALAATSVGASASRSLRAASTVAPGSAPLHDPRPAATRADPDRSDARKVAFPLDYADDRLQNTCGFKSITTRCRAARPKGSIKEEGLMARTFVALGLFLATSIGFAGRAPPIQRPVQSPVQQSSTPVQQPKNLPRLPR